MAFESFTANTYCFWTQMMRCGLMLLSCLPGLLKSIIPILFSMRLAR